MQQLRLWVLTLFVLGLFLPLSLVHSQQQGVKVSQSAPGQGSGEIVRRLEPVGGDLSILLTFRLGPGSERLIGERNAESFRKSLRILNRGQHHDVLELLELV